jgi:predicted enzyme related to lactoylglutathione lyase
MARVQLALNVADLDEAIDFYSKLFATSPAKVRPGYANSVAALTRFIRGVGGLVMGSASFDGGSDSWSDSIRAQCVCNA